MFQRNGGASLTGIHAHTKGGDGAEDRAQRPQASAATGRTVTLVDTLQFATAEVRFARLVRGFSLAGFAFARRGEAPAYTFSLEDRADGFTFCFARTFIIGCADSAIAHGTKVELFTELASATHAFRLAAEPHALILDQGTTPAACAATAAIFSCSAEVAGAFSAILELHCFLASSLHACRLRTFADAVLFL